MDRHRGALRLLLLGVAALVLSAAAAPSALLLREQAWTAPGATLAHDLTHAPGECLTARTPDVEIGRALFRSPVLFGGPAARAGLSCNACHSGGAVNARFLLPELTDRTAHADVTSEWSSKVRGDGVMNPQPIPDLANVSGRPVFGHLREPSLESFVRSVIVDEFQGRAPPDQAFEGVIAYLRALRSEACPAGDAALTLAGAADDVRRAVAAAEIAQPRTASLLLFAAQDAIGRIVERLPQPSFAPDRRRFERLARELGALRNAEDMPAGMAAVLPGWRARFDASVARTAERESRTYFNEATLRTALSARTHPEQRAGATEDQAR
jgi:hypothetical protein